MGCPGDDKMNSRESKSWRNWYERDSSEMTSLESRVRTRSRASLQVSVITAPSRSWDRTTPPFSSPIPVLTCTPSLSISIVKVRNSSFGVCPLESDPSDVLSSTDVRLPRSSPDVDRAWASARKKSRRARIRQAEKPYGMRGGNDIGQMLLKMWSLKRTIKNTNTVVWHRNQNLASSVEARRPKRK